MEGIIAAIITGVLALTGVIISNISSNRRVEASLEKAQAVTDTRLEELTREVRLHNGFAEKIPVIQEQIKAITHRIEDLEQFHKPNGNGGSK